MAWCSFGCQHFQWALGEGRKLLAAQYGITLNRVIQEDDPVRLHLLAKGFAQVSYHHQGGTLHVEAAHCHWLGEVITGFCVLVKHNVKVITKVKVDLLSQRGRIVISESIHYQLKRIPNRNKVSNLPLVGIWKTFKP